MGAGFTRRFASFPGTEVITQIEGVVIIDTPPPGSISGVNQGVVMVIGEFSDMSSAVQVSLTGGITTKPRAIEIFSAQDLNLKAGGFDEFLGEFGGDFGNGFCTIRNKSFSRLLITPVDVLTPATGTISACRFWRDLPTCISATNPGPIVPVSAAVVAASLQFKNGSNRARIASRFSFSDDVAFVTGVDGSVTTAAAAATQVFTSAGSDFTASGVQIGDILVVGIIGTSLGTNADTYRVTIVGTTTLTVQAMDGSNFAFTTEASLPFRVHPAASADSAGVADAHVALSGTGGYTVLVRPLDATIAAATALSPTVVPPAGTATAWDPLSGLTGVTHPTGALTYDANLHAPNVANNATMDARYQAAIDAILTDSEPARDTKIVVASRKSSTIRNKLRSHVDVASARGLSRRAIISPSLDTLSLQTVTGSTDPGVGANRSSRVDYSWPGAQHSVPEAVGFVLSTSDGKTTSDGILDDPFDAWLASAESSLAPERNPGQAADPIPSVFAPVLAFERGTPDLAMPEYISLRSAGIAALRFDRVAGPLIQSGITTSLVSGQKNISTRRMTDFIQDSLADRIGLLAKLPSSRQIEDSIIAEIDGFLNELLSPNNPAAQRIAEYQIDSKSGNTPELRARGIFVIIVRVRLIPTDDFIVLQTEIGEGVVINQIVGG